MAIRSKRDLEIVLSKLKTFNEPSVELEQYGTPSSIAADWVWGMAMKKEVAGKQILDAGCGPGILGLGLLLMGAKKVYFLDKDKSILTTCMKNFESLKKEYEIKDAEFILGDISLFDQEVDVVVQNPPFGTKDIHSDKKFLEKAFSIAPLVYSMHKWSTKNFIETVSRDFNFKIVEVFRYDFPIKATFDFHQKPVRNIDVGLWRLERQ